MVRVGTLRVRVVEGGVVSRFAELGLEREGPVVGWGLIENALPHARRSLPRSEFGSFPLRIEEERPAPSDVRLANEEPQQGLVPLEPLGILPLNLVDAIEELLKDGTRLLEGVTRRCKLPCHGREERLLRRSVVPELLDEVDPVVAKVTGAVSEPMTVRDPVLLDEYGEAARGAEEGVEAELGEGGELRGAVPSVGAVDEGVRVVEVHRSDDDEDAVEDVGEVGEPACSAESDAVESSGRFGVDESCKRSLVSRGSLVV